MKQAADITARWEIEAYEAAVGNVRQTETLPTSFKLRWLKWE